MTLPAGGSAAPPGRMIGPWRSDRFSGLLLLLLALHVGWANREYPLGSIAEPGPGYVPLLIAVFLGLIGVVIALRGGESPTLAAIGWVEAPRALVILFACGVAAFALERIGYRLTMTALLVFFLGVVERKQPVPVILVAAGFSLASYYLFATLLKVQLPRSPWGF